MKYLLDANPAIGFLAGVRPLLSRLEVQPPELVALPAIALHELYFGAFKSQRVSANVARVDGLLFNILDFDAAAARVAGQLRAHLQALGTPIGAYDVLIAAQALSRNLVLVTHNVREFGRVPELRVVDWEG